jgi:hypothetical protein
MYNNIKQIIWFPFFILFSFLFQSCQPLNTNLTHQTDNLSKIANALKRVQTEGNNKAYAVFTANDSKNYYVQVGNANDIYLLHTEAVSNRYLEKDNRLQANQINMLKSLGWNEPEKGSKKGIPNFYRVWKAIGDDTRLVIAQNLLDTLIKVYGFNNSEPINIKMERVFKILCQLTEG